MENAIYRIKEVSEYLRYDFTDEETRVYARDMARAHQELARLEEEKAAIVAQFKSDIEGKNKTISDLSRRINNGHEYRSIDCEWRFNVPEQGRKTLVRLDTGEIVKVERMSTEEKQEELPLELPEDGGAELPLELPEDGGAELPLELPEDGGAVN